MKLRLIWLISFILLGASLIQADSLWSDRQSSFYGSTPKRVHVGDVITVYISESTSAVQEASTRTQKASSLTADLINNWDQVSDILGDESIRKELEFEISGGDDFKGTGKTSRRSRVQAVLSAIVTEILEGGNLYIVGEHKVKVNDELETIRIAGIIRPQDIKGNNSIMSFQIAKAEVSVKGSGVVGAKQTPGILTKMFNWLF